MFSFFTNKSHHQEPESEMQTSDYHLVSTDRMGDYVTSDIHLLWSKIRVPAITFVGTNFRLSLKRHA